MRRLKLPKYIIDRWIRHKSKLHHTPLDRFTVRIACTVEEHEDAFRLIHVAYVYQGIESVRGVELRITPQHVLPESTIFVAYEGEMIVGTLTVTLDSPAKLALDSNYPGELDELRSTGARLAEYGSLAVVKRCWHNGVTTLLNMAAHWFTSKVLKASYVVIGIHPQIAPFYRAVYKFALMGAAQHHADLQAPVQGMVQRVNEAVPHLEKHFRRPMESGLLPHEHFGQFLPRCVNMPEVRILEELVRWKLPRHVFQELFIQKSDRLAKLDDTTRSHLEGWRSIYTLSQMKLVSTSNTESG